MNNENANCTWEALESQLFDSGAKLLEVAMQAAQAKAALSGSQLLIDLLHRTDLAPRLAVAVTGTAADLLTMSILLHDRNTGEPVARLFEISAQAEPLPCLH